MIAAILLIATTATSARDLTALTADCGRDPKGCAEELDLALVLADEAQTAREDVERRLRAAEASLADRNAEIRRLQIDLMTIPVPARAPMLVPPTLLPPASVTPWRPLFTAVLGAAAGAGAAAAGCDLFGCKAGPAIAAPALGTIAGAVASCLVFGCDR